MGKIRVWTFVLSFAVAICGGCSDNDGSEPEVPQGTEGGEGTGGSSATIVVEPLTETLRPVYTAGKRWEYVYVSPGSGDTIRWVEKIVCDTVWGGEKCFYFGPDKFRKEDNGKLYGLGVDTGPLGSDASEWVWTWGEILDMNAQLGLVYEDCQWCPLCIVARGTVVVKGKTRRALKLSIPRGWGDFPAFTYWVEGIGALHSVEPGGRPIYGPHPLVYIEKCLDGDDVIFDMTEFDDDLFVADEELPESEWPD